MHGLHNMTLHMGVEDRAPTTHLGTSLVAASFASIHVTPIGCGLARSVGGRYVDAPSRSRRRVVGRESRVQRRRVDAASVGVGLRAAIRQKVGGDIDRCEDRAQQSERARSKDGRVVVIQLDRTLRDTRARERGSIQGALRAAGQCG